MSSSDVLFGSEVFTVQNFVMLKPRGWGGYIFAEGLRV